jgi:Lar family restriction alleviation protein
MSDDLKPCPFCGGDKNIVCTTEYDGRDAYAVSCRYHECHGSIFTLGYGYFADRAEAIAAWNTRTPDPRIEALTEQLKTVLDREAATTARYDAKLETLTEQLEAARADAKEAEAYAEELAKDQVDLCSQLIAAEDKLAKAMEGLNYCINAPFSGWTIAQGYARALLAEIESSTPYGLEGEKG